MQIVRFEKIPEEDRRYFRFLVDDITINGKPLRDFLVDKDADFIIASTVADGYVKNVYSDPNQQVLLADEILYDPDRPDRFDKRFAERSDESFNSRATAYTEWRRKKQKRKR